MNEVEAIDTLNAYRNGFPVTEPGELGVPTAYVELVQEKLADLPEDDYLHWRARLVGEWWP